MTSASIQVLADAKFWLRFELEFQHKSFILQKCCNERFRLSKIPPFVADRLGSDNNKPDILASVQLKLEKVRLGKAK